MATRRGTPVLIAALLVLAPPLAANAKRIFQEALAARLHDEVPSSGRPLVLLYGLTGHRDEWRGAIRRHLAQLRGQ